MPTLCFGGSFNPIHNAHLVCAQVVAEKGGYERVLLIPSATPPHKMHDARQSDLASPQDRLAMCRLGIAGSNLFDVSDIETRRGGPSYTIDTVRQLKAQGWPRVDWLIGADMLMFLPKWHQPLELLAEAHFVIMARPGFTIDWSRLPAEYARLQTNVVQAPQIAISATEIRRRVRSGEPIEHLVPAKVARYIAERGLYR
jgi:nicotinate-nucleotide adenylyltransferase